MKAVQNVVETQPAQSGKLLKILGIGFGIAVGIGATVGVGILRSPGLIAEQLGSPWLIMLAWTLGGVYCLLGANYLAELATMIPKAGGYYVYAQRAFGKYGGFVVGWSDWLYSTLGLSFISVVFGEYASALFAPNLSGGRIIFSVSILAVMTILNLLGLRAGSETQKLTSFLKAVALIGFVVACFVFGGQHNPADTAQSANAAPTGFSASFIAFIIAFQLVLSTYDGWHSAIYFSEEDTNPTQNLPRSMFGGIIVIIAIYLLVNLALIYVLPMSQFAASKFAGADAMNLIFGAGSGQILTTLALLSLIGIINALLMCIPRTMFALGREGLFTKKAAAVNKGGTPVFALITTALCAVLLSLVGTFEMLLAVSQFFALVITILLIVSLFALRRREPDLPRPFRARFYPFAPALMFVFAVLLLFGYIISNPYPSLYALALLAVSYPIFRLIKNKEIMNPKTPFLLSVVLTIPLIFFAHAINQKSFAQSRTNSKTNCQSADFPSFVFSESNVFPKDKPLHRPEDGKALADGRIIVGDEEFGLRIVEKNGKSRPFGKFKEAGWIHNPPQFPAGPNGMFLESDNRHLLFANVYTGKIYRVDTKTEETKMIYDHPFGVNSLVRDSKGTVWFTQSSKNTEEKGVEDLYGAINQPVDSGAVFYLRGSGSEVKTPAVEAAGNIYFANGIALDTAEKYLYVAETMMDRILRYEINNSNGTLTKRETYQYVFAPDNIEFDKDGNLWIASPFSNKVFAVDKRCLSLHTIFSAPSESNAKVQDEWTKRSHLGKPLLELFSPDLWKPLPGGALTGMFWSQDYKTFYVTGLGNAVLKVDIEFK